MPYGWVGSILYVDLSTGRIDELDTMRYALKYLGGRGIAARIAWEILPPDVDAYDPRNPLIAMTGPLTGTLAPTSGRIVFCSVSPRVYPKPWYTHSTMGGFLGSELKYAGFDGFVVVGRSEEPVYLWIHDRDAELLSAKELWGLTVRQTVERLRKVHGPGVQVACIGPAGENLVRFAAVSHPPENASGHSGFGAVMGAKRLKAVAVKGGGGVKIADPGRFVEACKYAMRMARTGTVDAMLKIEYRHPIPSSRPVCGQSCSVNCRIGRTFFDVPRRLDGEGVIKAHQVFCIGGVWTSSQEQGGYEGGGFRVPPITGWEPGEGGVELHMLCDDLGIDLWVLLVFQPWLVRCIELGVNELRGLKLKPRDAKWFQEFLRLIAYRKGVGDVLAEDLRRAVDSMRGELPKELIELAEVLEFAYGFPAHREGRIWDPEPLPFWLVSALMYATESRDPTICTHASFLQLAELYLDDRDLFLRKLRPVAARLWGSEKVFEPSLEDKIGLTIWCQHRHVMLDCLPLCDFTFPRLLKPFKSKTEWLEAEDVYGDLDIEAKLLSMCTGLEFTTEQLEETAERIFNLERMMLVEKFGRRRDIDEAVARHFQLPCKTDGTRIGLETFRRLLDEYYRSRGWDPRTGVPTKEKLEQLGLDILSDHPL